MSIDAQAPCLRLPEPSIRSNPGSIVSAACAPTRENARAVRGTLTAELWETLERHVARCELRKFSAEVPRGRALSGSSWSG